MSDYITGHAHKSAGAGYGVPTLEDMAEGIISFLDMRFKHGESLDLARNGVPPEINVSEKRTPGLIQVWCLPLEQLQRIITAIVGAVEEARAASGR